MAATLRERHLKAVLSTDDEERNRLIGFPGIKESTVEKDIENLQPETLKDGTFPSDFQCFSSFFPFFLFGMK